VKTEHSQQVGSKDYSVDRYQSSESKDNDYTAGLASDKLPIPALDIEFAKYANSAGISTYNLSTFIDDRLVGPCSIDESLLHHHQQVPPSFYSSYSDTNLASSLHDENQPHMDGIYPHTDPGNFEEHDLEDFASQITSYKEESPLEVDKFLTDDLGGIGDQFPVQQIPFSRYQSSLLTRGATLPRPSSAPDLSLQARHGESSG
jgi:hypothetical protein